MDLPSDTPRLPKWIFLTGDAFLLLAAWYIADQSARPMTGSTLVAIAICVAVAVVLGAFPFVADYARRQDEALDNRQRALQALQQVGLGDRLSHHTSQLSGGQQQRIAIARALINRPELVLADEPTGNLDTRTSIEIMGLFQQLNQSGITLVMVTHELDIAAYCQRIVVMRDGRVIRDTRNEAPRSAREEIAKLDQAEQKAKLA